MYNSIEYFKKGSLILDKCSVRNKWWGKTELNKSTSSGKTKSRQSLLADANLIQELSPSYPRAPIIVPGLRRPPIMAIIFYLYPKILNCPPYPQSSKSICLMLFSLRLWLIRCANTQIHVKHSCRQFLKSDCIEINYLIHLKV